LKVKVGVLVLKAENTALGIRLANHPTPLYAQTVALTSPASGDHSVDRVRSRTKATEVLPFAYILTTPQFVPR
jgi:hypothetical protein